MSALVAAYEALLEIAVRQLEALEADEAEAFSALVEEREARFEAVRALEAEAAGLAPNARRHVAGVIGEILEIDRRLEAAIAAARGRNQGVLTDLQTGLAALHSYAQSGSGAEALFIDRNQ